MLKNLFTLYPLLMAGVNLSFSEEPDVEIIEEIKIESPSRDIAPEKKESKKKKKNSPFIVPFKIVRPERMALTPNLEIPITEEQWDIFSTEENMKTYLQWEPGTLYGAAKIPVDKDLIVSLSTNNGWLNNQSIEIRFSQTAKGLKHEIKKLNANNSEEFTWTQDKILSDLITCTGSQENEFYHVRFKMNDCLYKINQGSELSIRFDLVDPNEKEFVPYHPRLLQNIKLVTERSKDLPHGFNWSTHYQNHRHVSIGEYLNVKFDTRRPKKDSLERIQLTPRGWDANQLTFINQPYPEFNRQDKASFSYTTLAPKKTTLGYKILNVTPNNKHENMGVMETSFNVSSPIIFDFNIQKDLKYSEKAQIVKGILKMTSVTNYKIVGGRLTLDVPMHWKILEGEVTTFALHAREFIRTVNIEIVIPGETEGIYPLNFKVVAEDYKPIYYTGYILIRK